MLPVSNFVSYIVIIIIIIIIIIVWLYSPSRALAPPFGVS
jgi:small-conductance mechanosensitive channel